MADAGVPLEIAFYGPLRPIVGKHLLSIRVPGSATLADVLQTVLDVVPSLRPELVDADGQALPYVHLFVNGRDYVYLPNKLTTVVRTQDRIDIFPATAGG